MSVGTADANGLVYRMSWKRTPAARPVDQQQVGHPDIVLGLHGPGAGRLKKSHHDEIEGDPYYLWSGTCDGAWAVSFRHRRVLIDVSRGGRVRWRARQSGAHRLHLIVKPMDRPWIVSELSDGASAGWREFTIELAGTEWCEFDLAMAAARGPVRAPDAARVPSHGGRPPSTGDRVPRLDFVDAVGVTDFQPGGGSDACSRLDWLEVWGRPVARPGP